MTRFPPIRILLLLSQLPHDPASGAARSIRTISEYLAASGMVVKGLGTTASEGGGEFDAIAYLSSVISGKIVRSNAAEDILTPADAPHRESNNFGMGGSLATGLTPVGPSPIDAPVLTFSDNGVDYTLLHTGGKLLDWEAQSGRQFDRLFDNLLKTFRPDIVFTFGGHPPEIDRRRRARAAGCCVVFGLRNLGYLVAGAFEYVDAVLTGSRFLTEKYRAAIGLESTPLPLPLDEAEVIAPRHERIFITYINPSIEKGVMFVARLAEELSLRRPDLPMLIVESRGTGGMLVKAGELGGFDLRRHENLMFCPPVARPAEIYALARVVIAPSVWEEPAGRVAAEAVANGIPAVVSDRGGLGEMCGAGGFVLPLPDELTLATRVPVSAQAVEPWIELLARLCDDQAFYEAACARAADAGKRYDRKIVAREYVRFFEGVIAARSPSGRS